MRQAQHKQRARGRGRKPQNANRSFESNGPDVKVRGTAATIAEKYMTLARDAQVSGDPVSSENYLQHAEHYFRIIAAAQAYTQSQQPSEQPQVMNGHDAAEGNDESNPREARSSTAQGDNVGQGADQGEQPSVEGGDEAGDGRSRRNRGRRGRRPASGDGSENAAEAGNASEAAASEPKAAIDDKAVAEAS